MRLLQLIVILAQLPAWSPGYAQVASVNDDDERWRLEEAGVRFVFYDQEGRGFQSQADLVGERGSEEIQVYEPLARMKFRQNPDITHTIVIPIDVVSAASPDALDAVSTASAVNQAARLDVTSSVALDEDQVVTANYGFHTEEHWRSWFLGAGYSREMAEDNATLTVSTAAIIDMFDNLGIDGRRDGRTGRVTANADVALSQVLSPTTVAAVAYGVTLQHGTLEQTWNSVPLINGDRVEENLPEDRLRHAFGGWLAQHVPATRTTLRGRYRYYIDDSGLSAHTAAVEGYQYLGDHILARLSYRVHGQSSVDYFGTAFPVGTEGADLRTADSDLASFTAHEFGAKVALFRQALGASWRRNNSIDLSFYRYERSNDLVVNVLALGYMGRY